MLPLGGKRGLIRVKPLVHDHHAVDDTGNIAPADVIFLFRGIERATEEPKQIIIGTVASRLSVGQSSLIDLVGKEPLNEIAAFLDLLMGGKERCNLYSMIFECGAGADELSLFAVLMEVGGSASEVIRVKVGKVKHGGRLLSRSSLRALLAQA